MTGFRVLVGAALTALLLLLPSTASAQQVIPHAFLGSATVNGNPAADGTSVSAFVDGVQIASSVVAGGGYQVLKVGGANYAGKIVTFTIGGLPAAETANWVQGGATQLNLTATPVLATATPLPPTPTPVIIAGERGEPGPTGLSGVPGNAGIAGLQGVQGSAGPPGSGGPAGPAGSAGPAGLQGPQGLAGPEGDTGESGGSVVGILALVFAVLAFLGTFGGLVWRWLIE